MTSASSRYFVGSSAVEWGVKRYVTASMSVGPPPSRARATASRVTATIASRSLPSAWIPGKPYASARWASVFARVCLDRGTEIAHWLLTHTNTIGARKTPAKFIASWQIPSEDAPSPK